MILALMGKAGAGKDTFYNTVLAPLNWKRIAFADPLKAFYLFQNNPLIARDVTALADPEHGYYTVFGSQKSPPVRSGLQQMGTEVVREGVDPGFWLYCALPEIHRLYQQGISVAVTDARFENEIRGLRGEVYWMQRFYASYQGPILPQVAQALSQDWEHGGLLPPPGIGYGMEIARTGHAGLQGQAALHASEQEWTRINPDYAIEARDVQQLQARGRDWYESLARPKVL